jgi:hypothetical protein
VYDPIYEKIKEEFCDRIQFFEYEIEKDKEMVNKYGVATLPTTIYFKGNEELMRHIKPERYETIKTFIEKEFFEIIAEEVKK